MWDLDVPLSVGRFTSQKDVQNFVERFHAIHQRMYAVHDRDSAVECINWRGRLTMHLAKPLRASGKVPRAIKSSSNETRIAHFAGTPHRTQVYRGTDLKPGIHINGPAIIEEPTTTIVIPPYAQVVVSASGNYILHI